VFTAPPSVKVKNVNKKRHLRPELVPTYNVYWSLINLERQVYLDLDPGSYSFDHSSPHSPKASSLQARKEMGSTMVGCLISQPGANIIELFFSFVIDEEAK
jgi:hypothetical protein